MIIFHRFLIATAILFCLFFAAWEWIAFRREHGLGHLLLGLAFGIAAVAFGYYLKNLKRFLRQR